MLCWEDFNIPPFGHSFAIVLYCIILNDKASPILAF